MWRKHRLSPLEVRVTRQDDFAVGITPADKRPLDLNQAVVDFVDRFAAPQPKVGRNLIVTAASRVEFSAGVTNPVDECPLDVQVDVFQLGLELKLPLLNLLANGLEALLNLSAFICAQQTDLGEHLSVRNRGGNIMRVQAAVKADAFAELLDAAVRRLVEDSSPSFGGQRHHPPERVPKV
jgi:hypothetical protein